MTEKHRFYYDESEHSRKINHQTVSADNYYDGFISAVVGWEERNEEEIKRKYYAFEEKHSNRKAKGEIKSTTIRQGQLERGFATLSQDTAALIGDFLDLFDDKTLIYFSAFSKIEYVIRQVFARYENSLQVNMDLLKYSVTKAIVVYRPRKVLSSLYGAPDAFLEALREFLLSRIEADKENAKLKAREIEQFSQILLLLDEADEIEVVDWSYEHPLTGLKLYLQEKSITDYSLAIDREARTAESARKLGFDDVSEGDSRELFGLRMADMLAGIVAKLMKSFANALRYRDEGEQVKKNLLDKGWFNLTEERLLLYKKLHRVVMAINNAWYKVFAGVYVDDLICLTAFLSFVNEFATARDLKANLGMMPEYFNTAVCNELESHYALMAKKNEILQGKQIEADGLSGPDEDKRSFDADSLLPLRIEGQSRTCSVLSVAIIDGTPLVVIEEGVGASCYALPDNLLPWVSTLVAMSQDGIRLLPEKVTFTKIHNGFAADIH